MDYLHILTCFALIQYGHGMIGYDRGAPNLNVTTVSLLDVEECDIPKVEINSTRIYLHLLQISEYENTMVRQCKLSIRRTISYCGMHSHTSMVSNGITEYMVDMSNDQCNQLHETGKLIWDFNKYITGIQINQTTIRSLTFAGSVTTDGKCEGVHYSDPYGTWENVIVQGTLTISLYTYSARVHLETDKIHLRTGTVCRHSTGTCIDMEGGYTFWKVTPIDKCNFEGFSVLYRGPADRIIDPQYENSQVIYSLTTQETTFALGKRGEEKTCGYTLIKTEHPKLIIVEGNKGIISQDKHITTENLDIFAYINSKFVYVEKHFRTQLNQLYHNVLIQRCNLEQQVMKNALTIATQMPDEFAYHLMKGPGYMAAIRGEVVHIIKCIPAEITIKKTTECYQELPVKLNNQTYYMSPRTHILMQTGTQINCNSIIPPMYFLQNSWYKFLPGGVEVPAPLIMKPMTKATWRYVNPTSLATSGIYPQEDLEKLRDHIMFPVERPAVLNTIARGMMGQPIAAQGLSISNLLDQKSMENIVESTWIKFWGRFITFGSATAGVFGIYFFLRVVKLIIDTLIHGYALHEAYGWSIHLLGAIWDSLTNLLLHLSRSPKQKQGKDVDLENQTPLTKPSAIEIQENAQSIQIIDEKAKYPNLQGTVETSSTPYNTRF